MEREESAGKVKVVKINTTQWNGTGESGSARREDARSRSLFISELAAGNKQEESMSRTD